MPRTLYEIDLDYCRHYSRVIEGLGRPPHQEGWLDEAFDTLRAKWANIRNAQAWAAPRSTSDQEAARCSVRCARALVSSSLPLVFWLDDQVMTTWIKAAVHAARFLNEREDLAWLLAGLAIFEACNDDVTSSLNHFQESIALFQDMGNQRHGTAYAEAHLGHALLEADHFDEARTSFDRALTITKEMDTPRQTVHLACTALRGLARLETKSGNTGSSREYMITAITIAQEGRCQGCEANARDALALLMWDVASGQAANEHRLSHSIASDSFKQFDAALLEARRAASLYHGLRNFKDEARMLKLIARIVVVKGDPKEAVIALTEAGRANRDHAENCTKFTLTEADEDLSADDPDASAPSEESELLRYVAHFQEFKNLFDRSKYTQALAAWDRWWPAVQCLNRPQLEAEALGLRGQCHIGLKDFDAAIRAFEQALPFARSVPKNDLEAELIDNITRAHKAKDLEASAGYMVGYMVGAFLGRLWCFFGRILRHARWAIRRKK